MKEAVKKQTCVSRKRETLTVTFVQFTVPILVILILKYHVLEHEAQLMDASAKTNVLRKANTFGEKLLESNAPVGVRLSAMMTKFYALLTSTLVMVAQRKKFADKPSKILTESSVLEKNTLSTTKAKITEKIKIDEVDTFQLLITALYIARNGREKSNAQYMKTF
jgi:hypothetical protein